MKTSSSPVQFAICIVATPESDLEAWKLYRVLPDTKADEVAFLRVIDESGEDYLYPKKQFAIVELPETVQAQLLAVSES